MELPILSRMLVRLFGLASSQLAVLVVRRLVPKPQLCASSYWLLASLVAAAYLIGWPIPAQFQLCRKFCWCFGVPKVGYGEPILQVYSNAQ